MDRQQLGRRYGAAVESEAGMTWPRRQEIRHYLRKSIWVVPLASMFAGLIAARVLARIDGALGWTSLLQAEVFRTILMSLASVAFTLVVFVCSALLIALQLASAQLTPRIIGFI